MGFRTVVVKNRAELEFRLNNLIVRGETEKKIHIDEINTLIIQSTAVSLTASLLNEMIKNNIKIIFCDEKCNPASELLPYYGAHNTSKRFKQQFLWSDGAKARVWREIVRRKITEQSEHLKDRGFFEQSKMLEKYAFEIVDGDVTNREGHAAKVYFNCLLGDDNSRRGGGFINGCLNYGYAVLLSAFNRQIAASGYLTQLGIWHDNEFNQFNLACDLIEPLRITADRAALSLEKNDVDFKRKMANVLNFPAVFDGKNTTLDFALREYSKSVFHALENDDERLVQFPEKIIIENEL